MTAPNVEKNPIRVLFEISRLVFIPLGEELHGVVRRTGNGGADRNPTQHHQILTPRVMARMPCRERRCCQNVVVQEEEHFGIGRLRPCVTSPALAPVGDEHGAQLGVFSG